MKKLSTWVFKATCFLMLNVAFWGCDNANAQDYIKGYDRSAV